MALIIVDASVWIDYLGGTSNVQTNWLEAELDRKRLCLTDLTLCEILQGVRDEKHLSSVRGSLSDFALLETCGEHLAAASASNYRYLRSKAHTVRKTIDCLIATFCIENRHSLLHRDRDFDPFERYLGLKVIHPNVH